MGFKNYFVKYPTEVKIQWVFFCFCSFKGDRMATDQRIENDDKSIRSKTLWVLGLTFLLPIVLTMVAFYIYL